jgi:hypothetical protein
MSEISQSLDANSAALLQERSISVSLQQHSPERGVSMKRLVAFVVTLVMPVVLIVAGGALVGLGLQNDWNTVNMIGLGMIGANIFGGWC